MPGRISESDIAAVRDASPVDVIVAEYVALRRAGSTSMKGICPFHDEKTPSFTVRPQTGYYRCFGCGVAGDVIDFVERIEHLSFTEAVERLAGRAGVQISYERGGAVPGRNSGQRARLLEAHRYAADFYADRLNASDAEPARQFLRQRGFDDQATREFGCGFAPAGWDVLTKYLLGKGFSANELVLAGLAKEASSGSLIDRFRRRLLWPIRSISADVVGFGARKLFDDDNGPKYLNSPETPVFKKSELLYGVDIAKKDIARSRQAVVVEGYTDVMACHLAGVRTAVATCGTAFGGDHIGVLRRLLMDSDSFRGEVIFTFDGDAAGQKAALRAFDDEQRFVAQTFVAVERSGMDPCELRQARGDAAVRDLVARREPLVAFAIRSTIAGWDLDTVEGRVQALRAAAPLVARIKDRAMRPEYARVLARDLGMDLDSVIAEVRRAEAHPSARQSSAPASSASYPPADRARGPGAESSRYAVEREMLKVAVQYPVQAGPAFDGIGLEAYSHPMAQAVRMAIGAAGGARQARSGPGWVEQLRAVAGDEPTRRAIAELAVEPLRATAEPDARYVTEHLSRLQEFAADDTIAELRGKLQRVNPVEDPDEATALFGQLIALERLRREMRERSMGAISTDGAL